MDKKARFIAHVDMDAFFAAIEQRDNPSYRSKPVIVGADPKGGKGRGVVSTCSYEARRYGIHSAMPISEAYRRCPGAIFIPVDMDKYARVSSGIYDIFYSFTPDVEPVGIDEAFLDISGSHHLFGTPLETCRMIKSRIKKGTGLTASIGLAPTKMAAKIASDLEKPDGLVEVKPEALLDFLWPLDVRRIWGLGPKSEEALGRMGILTIGDLANRSPEELERALGANGGRFWAMANGLDERAVCASGPAKSMSGEHTFEEDTRDASIIESVLMRLCEDVSARLRREGTACRTVTVKIRLKGFRTYTRSATMPEPTNFTDTLYKEAKGLYNKFKTGPEAAAPVRLIGVKASGMISGEADRGLFDDACDSKREGVHKAIDIIRGKFGDASICHATAAPRRRKDRKEQSP